MKYLKEFLESSTIHGLVYISATKGIVKVFWTLVVLTGFSIAGYLIYDSFNNWSESPIKTTIETKSIANISFPKVTVCPPKNTFTELNYDLLVVENKTMTIDVREQILDIALTQLDPTFAGQKKVLNMSLLEEDNRFYNLLNGHTKLSYPKNQTNDDMIISLPTYEFQTSSTTGLIKTPNFDTDYDPEKIHRQLHYAIQINIPTQIQDNQEYVMTVEIERVQMELPPDPDIDLESRQDNFTIMDENILGLQDKILVRNFSAVNENKAVNLYFSRNIAEKDVIFNEKKLAKMPGFQIKWRWNKAVSADKNFIEMSDQNKENMALKRFLNIIDTNSTNFELAWNTLKTERFLQLKDSLSLVCSSFDSNSFHSATKTALDKIETILDIGDIPTGINYSEETYQQAEELLFYIYSYSSYCPPNNIKQPLELFLSSVFAIDIKDKLIDEARDEVHEKVYNEFVKNISKLQEENRFYNWYHGFTEVQFPYWCDEGCASDSAGLQYEIKTSATSGFIKTQYFGDNYDADKVERYLAYEVKKEKPSNENTNFISIRLEKIQMTVNGKSKENWEFNVDRVDFMNTEITNNDLLLQNVTAPFEQTSRLFTDRKLVQISDAKALDTMPGFRFSWSSNPDASSETLYIEHQANKEFRRLANLCNSSTDFIDEAVKKQRKIILANETLECSNNIIPFEAIQEVLSNIEYDIGGLETDYQVHQDIKKTTLLKAADHYAYLVFCPPKEKMESMAKHFESSLPVYSHKKVLILLSRLASATVKELPFQDQFDKILEKIREAWNPNFKEIRQYYNGSASGSSLSIDFMKEAKDLQVIKNPVHIINEDGNLQPSALIPFCWFGRKQRIGVMLDQFSDKVSICNNFNPKIIVDQRCYEIDPNKYINPKSKESDLKFGLTLVVDENVDRLFSKIQQVEVDFAKDFSQEDEDVTRSVVYLDTKEPLKLELGWKYNLNVLKNMKVTEDFLKLPQSERDCQEESYDDCTTRSYAQGVIKECGCLPFSIQQFENTEVDVCQPSMLECVGTVPLNDSSCLCKCDGLIVSSYSKTEFKESSISDFWYNLGDGYKKYKEQTDINFPDQLKGEFHRILIILTLLLQGYAWNDSYSMISIYIETPAFDEIEHDRVPKFVDMLSAIGGTFGLFTGFSLISGIEILFFLTKSFASLSSGK